MAAFLLFLLFLTSVAAAGDDHGITGDEADALLVFKASLTNASALSSWSSTNGSPCSPASTWNGIACDAGSVASLRLAGLGLSGRIDVEALARLPGLRSISLNGNSFSGQIPPFSRLQALKSIYLSGNSFSGPIPNDFFSAAYHLKKLWLSSNAFEGSIPPSLAKAVSLMELHLEGNRFSGSIPDLRITTLVSFNVSKNKLSGPIPSSLSKFNASSFAENAGLCGSPLENLCAGDAAAAGVSAAGASSGSLGATMGLVLLLIVIAGGAMAVAVKRQRMTGFETLGIAQTAEENIEEGERKRREQPSETGGGGRAYTATTTTRKGKRVASSVKGRGGEGGGPGAELIMVNELKGVFALPDLMRAAAEVIGNGAAATGGTGSSYKAVLRNGVVVAVKRMREMNRVGKETFEAQMRRLGRLNHPNVLPPLAYHYRKDEKLLVSEYIRKGSLLYVLHGDRGTDHAALNWPTRLKIIRGIANGLLYLHSELSTIDIPHGNLKSSNVLLGDDFEPLLVDYGFLPLINPSHASQSMFAYKSPEILLDRQVSPMSDVYCLGIIILELLSGRFPSQYLNNTKGGTDLVRWTNSVVNENILGNILDPFIAQGFKAELPEMERLVQVGAELIEADVDRRPNMKEASRIIEEVAAAAEGKRENRRAAAAWRESLVRVREGQAGSGEGVGGGGVRRTGSITERSRSIGDNVSFAMS
ncbi:putative inactive leucine-rich repeat receptor-like protein kinase [Platanthera guangdongensis]|uniref:Inactive leucine-rich repeat receptor-like protein kinase n=1 Tax=Platanthera guangdongensis TaxID=2320717 RepID=A0ABR2LRW0_9ASPA